METTATPTAETPICQSCGMPMQTPEEFGTESDASPSNDYCCYCYQGGEFTMPAENYEEMADKLVAMAAQMGMTEEEARVMADEKLPNLKRWKN